MDYGKFAVAAAPEAKIFQAHLQDKLLETPALIFSDAPEQIYVERASGRISFKLGFPRVFMRRQGSDASEDINFLVEWLTGGDDGMLCQETECYGIVKLRYSEEIERAVTEAFFGSMGGKVELPAHVREIVESEKASAKMRSRERVLRAIRRTYENMKKQLEANKEAGGGAIQPTKVELLCNYVLKHEIAAERKRQEKIQLDIDDTLGSDPFMLDNVMLGQPQQAEPVKRTRKRKTAVEEALDDGVQPNEV
jgi:hypothetical protein